MRYKCITILPRELSPEEASAEIDDECEISAAHAGDVSSSGSTAANFMSKIRSDPELATFDSILDRRNDHPKFKFMAYPHMTMAELLP